MNKFLTTPAGSWTKTFVSASLTQIIVELTEGHSLLTWDIHFVERLVTTGLLSALPAIINYLNPAYAGYGIKPKDQVLVDNPEAKKT